VLQIAMGLDGVELIMRLEEDFQLQVPDADTAEIRTVNHLVDLMIRLEPELAQDRLVVFTKVQAAVADCLGVALPEVHPHSNLIHDLGMG
jgi:acyl carrier protein